MRPLLCLMSLLTALAIVAPGIADAHDEATETRFSTVKLFFVNQYLPDPAATPVPQGGTFFGGGMGGMPPAEFRFEAARLFLNGKFIGHAMLRHVDVNPKLNLPSGEHTLRITCDGYRDYETKLEVLRNGSTQWLVIELQPAPAADRAKSRLFTPSQPDGFARPPAVRSEPAEAIEKGMKADELERRKRIEDRLRKGPLDDADPEPESNRPPRKE